MSKRAEDRAREVWEQLNEAIVYKDESTGDWLPESEIATIAAALQEAERRGVEKMRDALCMYESWECIPEMVRMLAARLLSQKEGADG